MSELDFSQSENSDTASASGALREYRLWRRSNPLMSFATYLESHPNLDSSVVIELATTDLIQQISSGHGSSAEEYIDAISPFSTSYELSLDLVDAELCAKSDMGIVVNRDKLLKRFPSFRKELARLLEVHEIDLEASKNRDALPPPSVSITGYQLVRQLCRGHTKKSGPSFEVWDATKLSQQHSVQIILWKDSSSEPDNSFVSVIKQRSAIAHPSLLTPISAGKTNSDGTRYCYVVVNNTATQMLAKFQSGAITANLHEPLFAKLLLSVMDAANQLEQELGTPIPISFDAIALDKSKLPILIDFPWLGHDKELNALKQLGLLIYAYCLQDPDTRHLEVHLDAGYDPINLFDINPSVSHDMNSVYVSCVHPNEKKRYGSIEDAAKDLQRLVEGKRVKAPSRKRNWFGF